MNTLEIRPGGGDAARYILWTGMTPQEVCAREWPKGRLLANTSPLRSLNPQAAFLKSHTVMVSSAGSPFASLVPELPESTLLEIP